MQAYEPILQITLTFNRYGLCFMQLRDIVLNLILRKTEWNKMSCTIFKFHFSWFHLKLISTDVLASLKTTMVLDHQWSSLQYYNCHLHITFSQNELFWIAFLNTNINYHFHQLESDNFDIKLKKTACCFKFN